MTCQSPISILERSLAERELAECCAPLNTHLSLIATSALSGGALTGKYVNYAGETINECDSSRLTKYFGFQHRYLSQEAQKVIRRLEEVAAKFDIPLSALSLAWVYSRFFVTSTLIGATNRGRNTCRILLGPLCVFVIIDYVITF